MHTYTHSCKYTQTFFFCLKYMWNFFRAGWFLKSYYLFYFYSPRMFVCPLNAVISCPASYGVCRYWCQSRNSCCKNHLLTLASRKLSTSFFLLNVFSRIAFQRGFHLSNDLMEHILNEPPLKKRKSPEHKDPKHLVLKQTRKITPVWPLNVTAMPQIPSNMEWTETKTGRIL